MNFLKKATFSVVSTSLKLHNPADNIVITSTNQPDKTSIFVVIMHTRSSGIKISHFYINADREGSTKVSNVLQNSVEFSDLATRQQNLRKPQKSQKFSKIFFV